MVEQAPLKRKVTGSNPVQPTKMQLRNIKPIAWPEIYRIWKQAEIKNDLWIQRGFSSWEQWRGVYVKPLGLKKLKWRIGELKNIHDILNFYGGPFKAWKKHFYNLIKVRVEHGSTPTFYQLALLPEIKTNRRFKKLSKNFPKKTTLIAIIKNKKIIIIDGMHRCTALTLMINKKQKIKSKILIASAQYRKKTLPLLGQ